MEHSHKKKIEIITGYMRVMSSPSGFKSSCMDLAHAGLFSGSMAQKNLLIILVSWICNYLLLTLCLIVN